MSLTSHDVRRIKVCSMCGELGIHRPVNSEADLPIVVCTNLLRAPGVTADFQHPTCYAGANVKKLTTLPPEELDFIRICDVTISQMKGILSARQQSRAAAPEGRTRQEHREDKCVCGHRRYQHPTNGRNGICIECLCNEFSLAQAHVAASTRQDADGK